MILMLFKLDNFRLANYNRPMVFDFHTHCYKEDMAPKAMALAEDSPFGPFYDGTLKGLKDSMQKNGIDTALTLHIASKPEFVPNVNDWAIECASHKGIYAFGSIHPQFKDYKTEIARLKRHGIKGLKFHNYYQHFDCNLKEAYPIYEEAAAQGMVMLFHCGTDLLIPGEFCAAEKFAALLRDFRGAKIVGAHLGGCREWDRAFDLFLGKDIYLDTSFAFRFLDDGMKKRLIEGHDPEKLLFGSDGPWIKAKDDLELIYKFFPKNSWDRILYQNAEELLGITLQRKI